MLKKNSFLKDEEIHKISADRQKSEARIKLLESKKNLKHKAKQ